MTSLREASQLWLARWILPVSGPALENGCLAVSGDRILGLVSASQLDSSGLRAQDRQIVDFGESVIVPGLLNLHTHLDYSGLKHLDNYSPFFEWIPKLIQNSWSWDDGQWLDSALSGACELVRSGTSMVADSSCSGAAARAIARVGLRGIVGLELFGASDEDAERNFADWLARYERFCREAEPQVKKAMDSGRLQITIAPHTPYTVCPDLIRKALDWARERRLPMFIHLAESDAEYRWISGSDAGLDAFLRTFEKAVDRLTWHGQGLSPVAHMQKYNLLAPHVLAAHLVQINQADIDILASHEVSAVHCPRSNSRLRNGVAPLSKLIESGLRLGLGTDSAASCDDLDILAEARFAWNLHRAVDTSFSQTAEAALYYLTLGGACALNRQDEVGSLEPGKKADFAVFSLADLPAIARGRPYECLIYGGAKMKALFVDGKELLDSLPAEPCQVGKSSF
jgi:cytosine/adenosine deaminase-related metal-dependent hydrolase